MTSARGQNNRHRTERQVSPRTARWESGARQFLAMAALLLETHLAYEGGWSPIQQPWDVIEQLGDGSLSLVMVVSVTL